MSASSQPTQPPSKQVLKKSPAAQWWAWYVAAWLAALLVPCLIILLGLIAKLLEDGGLRDSWVLLGQFLQLPVPHSFRQLDPLAQLVFLVVVGLVIAWLQALALYLFYSGLTRRSREISEGLHQQVLGISIQVAEAEGITAQRNRTRLLVDEYLPQVHAGLVARYRAFPRSVVLTIVCTAVAVAVNVWLTLMGLISGLIVWLLYRWLDESAKARSSRYDLAAIRRRLIESVQTAPLVSRVRGDETPVDESGGPLGQLSEAQRIRDLGRVRVIPMVTAVSSLFIGLLLLTLGGNMLVANSEINLPAALVLTLSLMGAVVGVTRITRAWNGEAEFQEACSSIMAFVHRPPGDGGHDRMALPGVQNSIDLTDVTMLDGAGRVLLNRLSLRLKPGSMVAMLGTEPVAVSALAELLLGFGVPKSGTVTVDGVPMRELHSRWLSKNVLWIGSNGPVWSGSIQENLSFAKVTPDTGTLSDATRQVGVYDRLQQLSDGFSTLISADDARLDELTRYGLAIARAWLRKPAVIIVQEPPVQIGTLTDDPGLDALSLLAEAGSLVILLPQRLQTLRRADRVILLNDGQVAGEGRHEELLAASDLYRHLNYTLFNPYRHKLGAGRR